MGSGGAPWWLSIVTALIAGGFALLGVRWTQRHAAEQRRLDRLEDRRVEQRNALAEVLVTGREWTLTMGTAATMVEYIDAAAIPASADAERHRVRYEAHKRALGTARLVVRDEEVRVQIARLSESATELPAELARVLVSRLCADDTANRSVVRAARQEIGAYRTALDELERLTRERVVDDRQEVRRRWWQRLRLPPPRRRSRPNSQSDGAAEAA